MSCSRSTARTAALYGSQGQQRTVALSLKLAERQLIEELVGEPPLLLLDDVLSDLDDARRRHLFDLTAQAGSQTFLSCTNLRAFSKGVLERAAVYGVDTGEVSTTMRSTNSRPDSGDRRRGQPCFSPRNSPRRCAPTWRRSRWAEVVGPQVAGVTQVEKVQNGTRTRRPRQKQRLGQRAGPAQRRHAAPSEQSAGRQSPDRHPLQGQRPVQKEKARADTATLLLPPVPTEEDLAQIVVVWKSRARIEAAVAGIKDDDLARPHPRAMLRAARVEQWKRDQGWQPCARCGTLTFPTPSREFSPDLPALTNAGAMDAAPASADRSGRVCRGDRRSGRRDGTRCPPSSPSPPRPVAAGVRAASLGAGGGGVALAGLAVGALWLAHFQIVPPADVSHWTGGVAPVHLVGTVVSDPEERYGRVTLLLSAERVQTARRGRPRDRGSVCRALACSGWSGHALDYGDRVALDGHLEIAAGATNPGAFSWRDYLARRAVYCQLRVKRPGAVQTLGASTLDPYMRLAWTVRRRILAAVHARCRAPPRLFCPASCSASARTCRRT